VHVAAFGAAAGLDSATIRATTEEAPGYSSPDGLVLRAVDELHDSGTLTDETWTRLRAELDESTLLELVSLVGFYHLVSFLVSAVRVDHEPWAARFPPAAAQPSAGRLG
jgi:hypothetical protein